jgi:pimeloyl-ACP methyl ester carboxylesterase
MMRDVEPKSLRLRTNGGLALHAIEWHPEGSAVLLLHGFANDARVWDDVARALTPSRRIVALDLRGHGDSDWAPDGDYRTRAHVADVVDAIRALGLERASIVGHSLGGSIGIRLAAEHPQLVDRLVVVDTGPRLNPTGVRHLRRDVANGRHFFASGEEYESYLARLYPLARPETLARMRRYGLRERSDGRFEMKFDPAMRSRFRRDAATEQRSEQRSWRYLSQIRCPTLVARAAASAILSAETAETMVHEVLASGELSIVERSGHAVMVDNPAGLAASIDRFLGQRRAEGAAKQPVASPSGVSW